MSQALSLFCFEEPTLTAPPAVVAELPRGISDKARLLAELARRLSFPDYFGLNWDALDECLRDLSWLAPGNVVLKHADLPLAGDASLAFVYLSILADAIQVWTTSQERALVVVFPANVREQIGALLEAL